MWSCRGIFRTARSGNTNAEFPCRREWRRRLSRGVEGDGTTEMARVVSEWLGGERWIRLFLSPPRVLPVWQGRR
jgi:hypothetical protein